MIERLYADYLFNTHTDESEVESYELFDTYELLVTKTNGTRELYDSIHQAVRFIRPEKRDILEMNKDEYASEFGFRFTSKLRDGGMTLEDISEKTGISIPSLYMYLRGDSAPSFYNAAKLAKVLNCDINEFLRFPK